MAAPNITNHSPATPSPGEEVLLSFSVNFLGGDWQLEYFDNGWKIMPKSAMVIYQNGLVVRIPPTYSGNSMTVCFVVDPYSNPQYSNDYTFSIGLPIPEITGHFPTNPIAGYTVTLYLNSDFRNVPWQLEYRSGGSRWEIMPSSNITMYASSMTVLIPETFTGSTITFGLGVDRGTGNYIYSADYDITMGVRTDRIQYNQSGTIRNMEAKYNHNGVIKNVECWYNHNGVLMKVQ